MKERRALAGGTGRGSDEEESGVWKRVGRRKSKDGDGTKEEGREGNEKCREGMNVCV